MAAKPKLSGVKLIRQYAHGSLWIEKDIFGRYRFRFGTISDDNTERPKADFIYSQWAKAALTDNELMTRVNKIVDHFEKQYDVKPKGYRK